MFDFICYKKVVSSVKYEHFLVLCLVISVSLFIDPLCYKQTDSVASEQTIRDRLHPRIATTSFVYKISTGIENQAGSTGDIT